MRTLFEATFADNIKAYESEVKLTSKLSIFKELKSTLYTLQDQLVKELSSYKTPADIKDLTIKFDYADGVAKSKIYVAATQVYKSTSTSNELYHMFHFTLKLPNFDYGSLDWNGTVRADWNYDAAVSALKKDGVKTPFASDAKKFINGFIKFAKKLPIVQEYVDALDSFITVSSKDSDVHIIESIKSSILARLEQYGIQLSSGLLKYKSTSLLIYEYDNKFYIKVATSISRKRSSKDVILEIAAKAPKVFTVVKGSNGFAPSLRINQDFIEDI